MSNGWRMSKRAEVAKIKYHCTKCNYYMGSEHNFEDCYESDKGLKLICTKEMCEKFTIIA